MLPVSLPFLAWFPSPLQIPSLVFPRETQGWQTGWLFAGLDPAKDWMGLRVKAGPGAERTSLWGQLHTREAPGPQDITRALVKAGGLKPTQASPPQGKGRSALKPGFVFQR